MIQWYRDGCSSCNQYKRGECILIQSDIENLHQAGCDDGEILEVNQVCAYFNYSNRLLNGLGVTTQGDVIGYYKDKPSEGL